MSRIVKGLRFDPSFKLTSIMSQFCGSWQKAPDSWVRNKELHEGIASSMSFLFRLVPESFAVAVVTKDHSLSDLKQPTFILLQFSRAEVRGQWQWARIKVSSGLHMEALATDPCLVFFSFQRLFTFFGSWPCIIATSVSTLPSYLWPSCLSPIRPL